MEFSSPIVKVYQNMCAEGEASCRYATQPHKVAGPPRVSVDQVRAVMDHGTRRPATGVMVFNWGSLKKQMDKVDKMGEYYRTTRGQEK